MSTQDKNKNSEELNDAPFLAGHSTAKQQIFPFTLNGINGVKPPKQRRQIEIELTWYGTYNSFPLSKIV